MVVGLGVTIGYMVLNHPTVRNALALPSDGLWFGIQPVSSGVFGVGAGVMATVILSLFSRQQR
jgi:cation/acetate symporter